MSYWCCTADFGEHDIECTRKQVARLMVIVHLIEPALAEHHASEMDEAELHRRVSMYKSQGVEL